MTDTIPTDVVLDQLRDLAAQAPDAVSRMSMGQIARKLGMTRRTLYRRAGSREAIVASLADAGVKLRSESSLRERALEITADLLRERPIGELTVDAIAEEAGCSRHSIYDQFGSREGILKAVFERYSPLMVIERRVTAGPPEGELDLRQDAARLYTIAYDLVEPEWPVLRAFVTEVLRDPDSEIGHLFRDWYAPLALDALLPVLIGHYERGSIRPVPIALVVQAFVGPLMLHLATHERLVHRLGGNAPDRDTTIAHFSEMFCRAVGADQVPWIETASTGQAGSAPGR